MQELVTKIEYAQVYAHLQAATVTVLFYDSFLTLFKEIELFWRRGWTPVSILHFAIRILAILDNSLDLAIAFSSSHTPSECESWITAQTWIYFVEYAIVEFVFIIRTYVLWDNNKQIGIFLSALFILIAAGGAASLKFFFLGSVTYSNASGPFDGISHGCSGSNPSNMLWICYLLLFIHESAILFLTLFKVIRYKRCNTSSLFQTIFRDGVSFYICISVISIINIVFLNMSFHIPQVSLGLTLLHRNLSVILCIRLMCNIREAVDQGKLLREPKGSNDSVE